jgi:uncharacterized membrane-anchored protein
VSAGFTATAAELRHGQGLLNQFADDLRDLPPTSTVSADAVDHGELATAINDLQASSRADTAGLIADLTELADKLGAASANYAAGDQDAHSAFRRLIAVADPGPRGAEPDPPRSAVLRRLAPDPAADPRRSP